MEDFFLPATVETPEVNFGFSKNVLYISGEAYPENAMTFFAPIRAQLEQYLHQLPAGVQVKTYFALKYFNSSSTKLIHRLIGMLDAAGERGHRVSLHWYHDPDDDMMIDFGIDLREDFRHIAIELQPLETV